jgi:hypothetical protein
MYFANARGGVGDGKTHNATVSLNFFTIPERVVQRPRAGGGESPPSQAPRSVLHYYFLVCRVLFVLLVGLVIPSQTRYQSGRNGR